MFLAPVASIGTQLSLKDSEFDSNIIEYQVVRQNKWQKTPKSTYDHKKHNLDVDFLIFLIFFKSYLQEDYNQLGYQKVEDSSKLSVTNLYFLFGIFS